MLIKYKVCYSVYEDCVYYKYIKLCVCVCVCVVLFKCTDNLVRVRERERDVMYTIFVWWSYQQISAAIINTFVTTAKKKKKYGVHSHTSM